MFINPSTQAQQRPQYLHRRGAAAVEAAIAYSVLFMLLIGLLVGGLGVFRYQEMAMLVREAARYASVHGNQYQTDVAGATAATPQSIYNNVIVPRATSLDLSSLSYNVAWSYNDNNPYHVNSDGSVVRNTVTVTINYQWMPEVYWVGPITLSSSSTMPMAY